MVNSKFGNMVVVRYVDVHRLVGALETVNDWLILNGSTMVL